MVADADRPGPHVRVENLLDEEGDAVRARHDFGDQAMRRVRVEEGSHELADPSLTERRDVDHLGDTIEVQRAHEVIRKGHLIRPEGTDDGDTLDSCARQVTDRFEALRIGGVQVVQQHHCALIGLRDVSHDPDDSLQRQQP